MEVPPNTYPKENEGGRLDREDARVAMDKDQGGGVQIHWCDISGRGLGVCALDFGGKVSWCSGSYEGLDKSESQLNHLDLVLI